MSLDFLEDLASDYENALVQTGFGKFHLLLLAICGMIYLNTAIGVTIISFVLPSATCDFEMTSEDKGWLSASPMLGMLLGSYFWGCLADTKGRRIVLIATLLADGICGLLSSLAPYYLMFLFIRFFNGFSVAGAMGIVFPYLGEFQPTKYREKILCWMELFWVFGIIMLPGIAWAIIPLDINIHTGTFFYHSWNLFVAMCAIPSLLLGFWLLAFPESPKFLLEHGESDKALEILIHMFIKNTGKTRDDYPCKGLRGPIRTYERSSEKSVRSLSIRKPNELKILLSEIWNQTKTLCKKPYLKRTALTCGIQFCLTTSYYTLMVWFPELFQRFDDYEKENPGASASVCDVSSIVVSNSTFVTCDPNIEGKVFFHTIIIGLACIPTSFWLPLCVHRLGIKFFLVFSLTAAGVVTIGLYFVRSSVENLVLSCIFEALTSLSISTVYCVMVDLFPTNLRHKTRMELVRVSAAVMGIEFSYAAETAFVSPTLLKIGVEHKHMTLVWALSPLVGFFLCPILGSMSDRCKLNIGRRRPFIILLSVGVFLGLLLVPNGESLGYWFGDMDPKLQIAAMNLTLNGTHTNINVSPHRSTASETEFESIPKTSHPWGIFFTILGTVLLDFDADACQSPSRAYLLDVCVPEDHAKGLSTFTIMAGLGGFMGYSMGGINWDVTSIGRRLGGHVKAVFTIITFIFIACVSFTVTSFSEIPLWALAAPKTSKAKTAEADHLEECGTSYGAFAEEANINETQQHDQTKSDYMSVPGENICETSFAQSNELPTIAENNANTELPGEPVESLSHYLLSIVYMPHSLRMVCLTNLFCWMAHVCYSLYFTDFVGEAVFNGDPKAADGSLAQIRYEEGVRFGCWGMAMYSLSCACYSLVIEKLIQRFRAKPVYVGGLLFYCFGMSLMALTRAKASVIIFSWAAGVMYSTLFTMPYLLVAHYHSMGTFELDTDGATKLGSTVRGLGTDVAIVSSMVFLAQFILSLCMGTIVSMSGTTTAVVSTASFLSFCGALAATQIMYLDL